MAVLSMSEQKDGEPRPAARTSGIRQEWLALRVPVRVA